MRFLCQTVKTILMCWGLAASVVAVFSLVSPEKADMRLMRIVLIEVTLAVLIGQLLFGAKNWNAGLWTRRIVISSCSALIGTAAIVLSGLRPLTWQLCALMIGCCVGVSSLVYLLVDRVERRALARINEELEKNE